MDYPLIECITGDIARQADVEAVVNAANAQLESGGGVAGALHRAAGPELAQAGRPLAPIRPGQAVITEGFALPNAWVIHCLGPVYGVDEPSAELLAQRFRLAKKRHGLNNPALRLDSSRFCRPPKQGDQLILL